MFTGVAVTLDLAVLTGLLAVAVALGALAVVGSRAVRQRMLAKRSSQRLDKHIAEVLHNGALERDAFRTRIDDTAKSAAGKPGAVRNDEPGEVILRARVHHMNQVQQIWGPEARQSALDQVAAIMQRSLRGGDTLTGERGDIINEIEGEGFTILVHGAQENEVSEIAQRLRETLARTRIEGLSDDMRLTASFGIASRRTGDSFTAWRARAEAALSAAKANGKNQIAAASAVEEKVLLPAPAPAASFDQDGASGSRAA
ncbi:MAG: GGDEF domain-containing protein [Pseudomonadota bacterium]